MKTIRLALAAALALTVSSHAATQFSSLTTFNQDLTANMFVPFGTVAFGYVTKIQGTLPMSVDLANVSEGTAFRINSSTMWYGDNFQILLGQDPKFKRGATKATINTPNGNVQLSWTATNLTFSGTLVDYYSVPLFGVAPTVFPLNIAGSFTTNSSISIHFQYSDYSHVAQIVGTNQTTLVAVPGLTMPGMPPTISYSTVNNGQFCITADLTPPTIKFNSPRQNTVVTTDNVNVNVTVSDNVALGAGPPWLGGAAVLSYSVNGGTSFGDPNTLEGITSTTHSINLNGAIAPGTNTIVFIAADSSGNLGTNTLVLFYSEKSPIALATNGLGGITGITNGQMLETGRNYVITAKAGAGKILSAWQDTDFNIISRSNVLTFTMKPGLTLTASFADNPFPAFQGNYLGYFLRQNASPDSKQFGGFKLTLGASGSFSGTVTSGAGTGTFAGQFSYSSNGVQDARCNVVSKNSTNIMFLNLTTDAGLSDYGVVKGQLLLNNGGGVSSLTPHIPVSYADVVAAHVTNATVMGATPWNYHFNIDPSTNDVNFPGGYGFGTLTVAANGMVTGSITLADGDAPTTAFSSQLVYTNGYVPVFVPLYNKGGGLLMTLDLSAVPPDGSSTVNTKAIWVKAPGKKFYPNGFSTGNDVSLARFTTIPSPTPYGYIEIMSTDLFASSGLDFAKGAFIETMPTTLKFKGTVSSPGAVAGSFVDDSLATIPFKALVVPTIKSPNPYFESFGFFVRSNQSGAVHTIFSSVP